MLKRDIGRPHHVDRAAIISKQQSDPLDRADPLDRPPVRSVQPEPLAQQQPRIAMNRDQLVIVSNQVIEECGVSRITGVRHVIAKWACLEKMDINSGSFDVVYGCLVFEGHR
jgi:hypothetical protein